MIVHRLWVGRPRHDPWVRAMIGNAGGDLHEWDIEDPRLDPAVDLADRTSVRLERDDDYPRHLANVARWWLLREYGGVWLDHDFVPLVPLSDGAWTAATRSGRCSCAVAVPAGHELPDLMLDAIAAGQVGGTAPQVSGDRVLDRVCPADVGRLLLPFGSDAKATGAPVWGLHLWETTAARRSPIGTQAVT